LELFYFFAVRSLVVSMAIIPLLLQMDHHPTKDCYRHYQVEDPFQLVYLLRLKSHLDDLVLVMKV
jgi:hypothetical protein